MVFEVIQHTDRDIELPHMIRMKAAHTTRNRVSIKLLGMNIELVHLPQHCRLAPWLHQARVAAITPVLFGFSQGGIMLLEAAKTTELHDCNILVCATRFASLPDKALSLRQLGWLHGQLDPLFSPELALQAKQHLAQHGQNIQLQLFTRMQHELPAQAAVDWISSLSEH